LDRIVKQGMRGLGRRPPMPFLWTDSGIENGFQNLGFKICIKGRNWAGKSARNTNQGISWGRH